MQETILTELAMKFEASPIVGMYLGMDCYEAHCNHHSMNYLLFNIFLYIAEILC